MLRFATCVIIFAILSPLIIADDPCRVTDSTKGTIDISSLSSTDGKAKFADLTPAQGGNWKYSFNPCQPFSEDSCTNVAVCQVDANGPDKHILAIQDNVQWNTQPGTTDNPILSYSYQGDTGPKNVQIEMICTPDSPDSLQVLGEFDPGNYRFQLTSKCACWNGCQGAGPSTSPSPSGGGGGSFPIGAIFLIIIVALALVYFTIFALYNRFRLQQSGRDLIAHRTFWTGVPVYAKDGVVYLFRRVTGKGGLEYRSV